MGTNGPLTTLVDMLPPDIYVDLAGLEGTVFLDQASFGAALQNQIGPGAAQYAGKDRGRGTHQRRYRHAGPERHVQCGQGGD